MPDSDLWPSTDEGSGGTGQNETPLSRRRSKTLHKKNKFFYFFGDRRANIPEERTNIARSPAWLNSSPSVKTVPRSGCFADAFAAVIVTLPRSPSPRRTGF